MHPLNVSPVNRSFAKNNASNSKMIYRHRRIFFSISGMATEVPPETHGISMLNLASINCLYRLSCISLS
jgi:hypothetical protein